MIIEPTTPLGCVSAQSILDATLDMDLYEFAPNGYDLQVSEIEVERAAHSLLEIYASDHYEDYETEVPLLEAMLSGIAKKSLPTHEEYMSQTVDNSPDA